jgi:uncharacterized membrane protein
MKKFDHLHSNGWWHLLPNLCLLVAIIGQVQATTSPLIANNFLAGDWLTKTKALWVNQ